MSTLRVRTEVKGHSNDIEVTFGSKPEHHFRPFDSVDFLVWYIKMLDLKSNFSPDGQNMLFHIPNIN